MLRYQSFSPSLNSSPKVNHPVVGKVLKAENRAHGMAQKRTRWNRSD